MLFLVYGLYCFVTNVDVVIDVAAVVTNAVVAVGGPMLLMVLLLSVCLMLL